MSDKIEPALTGLQWSYIQHGYPWSDNDGRMAAARAAQFAIDWAQEGKLHAAAAAALHGQPFGFTREDVEDEKDAYVRAVVCATMFQKSGNEPERLKCKEAAARHLARAEKIAALLPPA